MTMTLLTFLLMYAFFYLPIPTLLLFRDGKAGEPLIAPGSKAQIVDWAGL